MITTDSILSLLVRKEVTLLVKGYIIAGSKMKFTDFLSRNQVGRAAIKDKYDEQYKIKLSTEHAELNAKYDSLFDSQSKSRTEETEKENQSQTKNIPETNHVNKLNANENTTSEKSDSSTVKNSSNSKITIIENEMNRKNGNCSGKKQEPGNQKIGGEKRKVSQAGHHAVKI